MIRRATQADEQILRELWEEVEAEIPPAPGFEETWEEAWPYVAGHIAEGVALLAEDDEGPIGYLWARRPEKGRSHVTDLYVRPRARRRGVAKALLREAVAQLRERGVERMTLWVLTSSAVARTVYERLGFVEVHRMLGAELDALEARLGADERPPSYGSVHVQTDDVGAVERAVRQFVPRIPGGSRASVISPPRNGWIAVYDEVCDRDPQALRRLARELSDRMGGVVVGIGAEEGAVVRYVLLERGRIVDEYLSVPEYYGPLPPGDVVALGANPTAAGRLTGADPARVRAVARTASSTAELLPAPELLAAIGDALRLEGADHGFEGASDLEDALHIAHRS